MKTFISAVPFSPESQVSVPTRIVELRSPISGYEDLIQEIVRTKNRIEALFRRSAIKVGGAGFYKDPAVLRELPSQAKQEVARALFEQLGLLMMQQREAYLSRFMGLR